ncbi:Ribokinase-like protein [Lojkania enalia]|uniref:Ribokinase-like protein n=1 Tax=Lojkania enalia TaxID=147567 RepID=A0A9P4KFD5_9PLEO|nr:Ribokinase-like protein [Didymosphaeria enalia]
MRRHIIAVGAIYIDTILTVPYYPGEDHKLRATSLSRRRGGNCANTFEVLEQLIKYRESSSDSRQNGDGISLHLLSVLPAKDSDAVSFIRDSFRSVALDPCSIYRKDAHEAASSYIIKSQETGSRTIVSYNELPELSVEEFVAKAKVMSVLEDAREGWYHFEGRNPFVVLDCIKYLRSSQEHHGFKISVEVEKPTREGLMRIAAEADLVFYSKTWAEAKGFGSAKECLEQQLSHTRKDVLLCCTWGSDGATAVQRSSTGSKSWATVKAWKPVEFTGSVIDAIGAGDTFIAGMLFALSHHSGDWSLEQKVNFANEIAGRKVFQEGFAGLGVAIPSY